MIVERVPQTTILQEFIEQKTEFSTENIETIETVVNENFVDYTLVVKTNEGIVQHEYLVNTETKEVKEVSVETITE
jgi:hypothetical protein